MVHVLIALVVLAAGIAQAETKRPDGKQILQRMVKAMETTDYQGTVVFHKNDNLDVMKYFHSFEDGKQRHERLVSLNSPQREIVRKQSEVRCLFKATKRLIVDNRPYQHSFIVDVPNNIEDLLPSYSFELSGEEEVATMPSYIIAIHPRDELRYFRKIWVTKAHFLPIKTIIYDLAGEALEQVVFTDLKVNKTIAQPDLPVKNPITNPVTEDINTAFTTRVLPPGFKQVFFTTKSIHQSGKPVNHLILSDGLASVSVYVEKYLASGSKEESGIPEGIHSIGAVNSTSHKVADSKVTVLGEVPTATVKMIAEGIEVNKEAAATAK